MAQQQARRAWITNPRNEGLKGMIIVFYHNIIYICRMKVKRFDIIYLDGAFEFLNELDEKTRNKIIYNTRKVQFDSFPELLKKTKGK